MLIGYIGSFLHEGAVENLADDTISIRPRGRQPNGGLQQISRTVRTQQEIRFYVLLHSDKFNEGGFRIDAAFGDIVRQFDRHGDEERVGQGR